MMKLLGKFLCLIGLHRWKPMGYNSYYNPTPVNQCQRCGKGTQIHLSSGGATINYSKEYCEEMKQIIAFFQRREEERCEK